MDEAVGTLTHEGVTVTSNQQTTEQMRESLQTPEPVETSTSAEPVTEPVVEKRPNPRKNPADRIAQLTAEIGNKDQALSALNTRLAEIDALKEEIAALKPRPAVAARPSAPVEAEDGRPTAEQIGEKYATYEDYVDAISRWSARQELKAYREQQATESAQQAQASALHDRMTAFNQRMADARTATPDWSSRFDAAIAEHGDPPVFPPMFEVLTESEIGPHLMLHLAEHPEAVERAFAAAGITPELAAYAKAHPDEFGQVITPAMQKQLYRQMSRLEAQVEAAVSSGSTPPVKASTRAHPPINPVSGSHTAPSDGPPDPSQVTQEQWDAYWNKQERESKRRR